jgi:hypothetical protein
VEAPKKKLRRPKEVVLSDGTRRVGDGPTYLEFPTDGSVDLYRISSYAFPEDRGLLRGLNALEKEGRLKPVIDVLRELRIDSDPAAVSHRTHEIITTIESILDRRNTRIAKKVQIRKLLLPIFAGDAMKEAALAPIMEILDTPSDYTANRLLGDLQRHLRAARKLRRPHPINEPHRNFRIAVMELAKKHDRAPTKGELAEHLAASQDRISQLSNDNGLHWLPTDPPGRRRNYLK